MRNLYTVVEQMLRHIPAGEASFRKALKKKLQDNLYSAPEAQDWSSVATVMMVYMREFEDNKFGGWTEEWCDAVIKIWKDENL